DTTYLTASSGSITNLVSSGVMSGAIGKFTSATIGSLSANSISVPSLSLSSLDTTYLTASSGSITNLVSSGVMSGASGKFTSATIGTLNTDTINSIGSTLALGGNVGTTSINLGLASTTQTVNIGTNSNTTTINIGGVNDTVNINGDLTFINSTVTKIADPYMILNEGSTTINNTGIVISKTGSPATTGAYVLVNSTSDAWTLKAGTGQLVTLNQDVSSTASVSFGGVTATTGTITSLVAPTQRTTTVNSIHDDSTRLSVVDRTTILAANNNTIYFRPISSSSTSYQAYLSNSGNFNVSSLGSNTYVVTTWFKTIGKEPDTNYSLNQTDADGINVYFGSSNFYNNMYLLGTNKELNISMSNRLVVQGYMSAASGVISNLVSTNFTGSDIKALTLTAITGVISNLVSTNFTGSDIKALTLTATTGVISNLVSTNFTGTTISSLLVNTTTLVATTGSITNLVSTNFTGSSIKALTLTATTGVISNLVVTNLTGTTLNASMIYTNGFQNYNSAMYTSNTVASNLANGLYFQKNRVGGVTYDNELGYIYFGGYGTNNVYDNAVLLYAGSEDNFTATS
ncbi:MAG: hypothetical protein EBX41_09920, partial [Chitinophagia bacterium]|nr:hypothetical protein [Chitinophagia bacterium]